MHGSDVRSVDDLWHAAIDWLGLSDEVELTTQQVEGGADERSATLGVPRAASVSWGRSSSLSGSSTYRTSRRLTLAQVARAGLAEMDGEVPIVIDDFHYVPGPLKQDIARALKTIIPYTSVVLIAVPLEAFAAVRSEPDMSWRVAQLQIKPWSRSELEYIAHRGFEALRVSDHDAVARKLAQNSYRAPFLMQELCYGYCSVNGLIQSVDPPIAAPRLSSWKTFFQRVADRNPPMIFEPLLMGPARRRIRETGPD